MRMFFGVLFLILAIALVIGCVEAWRDANLPSADKIEDVVLVTLSVLSSIYLFRSPEARHSRMLCRYCSRRGTLEEQVVTRPRPSLAAMLFGGFAVCVLVENLQKRSFRCTECSEYSYRWTMGSLLVALWAITVIVAAIREVFP